MKGIKAAFSVLPWPKTRGGPDVMMNRFIRSARRRRYTVAPDWLTNDRQPCLLNIGHRSQERVFTSNRRVVYRVAGMFLKDYFERMAAAYHDRIYRPEFDLANQKIRFALEQADFIIYQSLWSKKNLDTLHQRPEGTWKIIPNAVDLKLFSPPVGWPKQQSDIPVLGAVGSMRYRSRLEVLFDVAQRLPFRPKMLIIGSLDEHCRKVLAQILRDPSWKGYITHVDSVPPDHLPRYYRQMDCLVHTVAGDSCPNVVVEALACGVPVVCPEDGGTSELVDNAGFAVQDPEGICGETMRSGMTKAILNILEDLPVFQRRARQRAENNNNIEILTSNYLEALGFPPYAYERGIKYRAVHAIGDIGSVLTPHIYVSKNSRPQVALVLWDWNLGGIASWMFRIAGAMPEYEFHFIATHLEQHATVCDKLGTFAYTPGFWKLRDYFIKKRIELVQVHSNRWPVDAAKAAGVRHIIERTDGTRSCCALSKRNIDYVIVSAGGTLPFIHLFWPDVRTEIIHNALDLSEVDKIDSRRIADPKFVSIGRCSRFGRGKRLDLLLDAVAVLKHKGMPVHLVIAGEDSRLRGAIAVEEELHDHALSLGDSVTFYGRTDEPLTLTKGFDIGVCSSDPFNEGIPNSLIEPMACGKPVVATEVDQVSELVQDGVNGFLVPPGNVAALAGALEVLVRDPKLREKMGRAARRTIEERFSFNVALKKYKKVYASVLEYD